MTPDIPHSCDLLVIAVKPQVKCELHGVYLVFHSAKEYYLNKICIFIQDLSPHKTSGTSIAPISEACTAIMLIN
jgi:hypothetical protein